MGDFLEAIVLMLPPDAGGRIEPIALIRHPDREAVGSAAHFQVNLLARIVAVAVHHRIHHALPN